MTTVILPDLTHAFTTQDFKSLYTTILKRKSKLTLQAFFINSCLNCQR